MTAEELEEHGLTARGIKKSLSEHMDFVADEHRRQRQNMENLARVNKTSPMPLEDADDIPF